MKLEIYGPINEVVIQEKKRVKYNFDNSRCMIGLYYGEYIIEEGKEFLVYDFATRKQKKRFNIYNAIFYLSRMYSYNTSTIMQYLYYGKQEKNNKIYNTIFFPLKKAIFKAKPVNCTKDTVIKLYLKDDVEAFYIEVSEGRLEIIENRFVDEKKQKDKNK